MKILSVSQIREADAYTITNEPIPSIDLMERAARACYAWFHTNISRSESIGILCGQGNNGGDGLALARMLKAGGYTVIVYSIHHSSTSSPDFQINFDRLTEWHIVPKAINSSEELIGYQHDIWVDAILGSGLNKPIRGLISNVVGLVNSLPGRKVAIDIPTGLFADNNSQNEKNGVFQATDTLTFQSPKFSFLFSEFGSCAGDVHVLDIGLHRDFLKTVASNNYYITPNMASSLLPKRDKFDHKGTYGHAMLIAGGKGKSGAAILASKAALKGGCGLVTAYVPQVSLDPIQAAAPEVMAITDIGDNVLEHIEFELAPDAMGIGPGLGTNAKTAKTIISFLESLNQPVVVDADALNIIAQEQAWHSVPAQSILTPHPGELDRMLGQRYRGEDVYAPALAFAKKHSVNLLVKGAHSALYTAEGQTYFNSSGTPAMATAGSGDVLTGILTSLIAQGLAPVDAVIVGIYYHGLAGQEAEKQSCSRSVTATDIINALRVA